MANAIGYRVCTGYRIAYFDMVRIRHVQFAHTIKIQIKLHSHAYHDCRCSGSTNRSIRGGNDGDDDDVEAKCEVATFIPQ